MQMSLDSKQIESAKNFIFWVSLIGLFVVIGFISVFLIQSSKLDWHFSERPDDYITFGELIGALLTPIIALASVLLLWITLRVQMEELKKSNESLQRTSEATERVLEQEHKLFKVRLLDEFLRSRAPTVQGLKNNLSFNVAKSDGQGGFNTERYSFDSLIELIEQGDDLKSATAHLENMLNESRLDRVRLALQQVIDFGVDILSYYKYGGNVRHLNEVLEPLMDITQPISDYCDELIVLLAKYDLQGKIVAIDQLHARLDNALYSSEKEKHDALMLSD
jgi:uncharacterized membrane protein